ncbi:DUF1493 family protein [Erwinia tracheiphila]|uniref:Cytoplasmic protein n=1 Tax=Erwinia tracheiphila TaxID=65700 RepID=A0A0M2KJ88_9GAMM|nr:DUF1493 family protein [Erwinia tracheiphila]EOS94127.1 hypothetical protein ETR_15376 [Erwinia tracheiphila PSU-1]EOS95286.1 hypothetical protein ETR_09241 [Erwinia tracheiphila PSU-1]KKF37066.1 cytoplasmic protein [Erwinia tracheiphila]KKF37991.1 cytoplasmic protein [Erwinia tracheiphila]UIA88433.1 DUF1493 family protein [Erwinia tracheiphila]
MVTDNDVLDFFRKELPLVTTLSLKKIPLNKDDTLQEYAEVEDLAETINKYSDKYNVDVSALNIENYYPWSIPWFFRSWFTKEPVKQIKKPLTVTMFAESAKAGRWLYD